MSRSYKNTTIAILLACILTMSIGYAVLQQRLDISGTSKITSEFNIQVVGISEFKKEGYGETVNMDFTPTSATYSTNLQVPGDDVVYEIVIENKGNMSGYVYFESSDYGSHHYGGNQNSDETLFVGIYKVTKEPLDPNNEFFYPRDVDQYAMLKPGEKMYVYASASFDYYAESMPEEKKVSFTANFNFTSAFDNTLVALKELNYTLLDSNNIVTSGTGLYEEKNPYGDYRKYVFKSDGLTDVNNYVSIEGKLWRIISFDTDDRYVVVEANTGTNPKTIYSSTKNTSDDYYNHFENSDLVMYLSEQLRSSDYLRTNLLYTYDDYIYIENSSMGIYENDIYGVSLFGISEIMNATTDTNCSFTNLSSGGCQSWLTNNGDTFLINPVYSDENTNTGKIAYLENGKVISVDPRDTNYGNYLMYGRIDRDCSDPYITNFLEADGSRENPYILDTTEIECGPPPV